MRALILRRVGLLETGAGGPVIVGPAEQRRRAAAGRTSCAATAIRTSCSTPTIDAEAQAPDRAVPHRAEASCRSCSARAAQLLRNPSEARAGPLHRPGRADRSRPASMTWRWSAPGPAGLATAVYAGSEGLSVLVLDCRAFGGQAGASARIENYLGFPTGITGMALMGRAFNQAQKFGVEMAIPDEVASAAPRRDDGRFACAWPTARRCAPARW